jgi:GNAT superfamily N-acetyltransferase
MMTSMMDLANIYQPTVKDTQRIIPGLHIRPYTPEVIPALLDLTRATLGNSGATRKTEAFWRWKHQANPFGSSYGLYAWNETESKVVGLRVLMRWRFNNPVGRQLQAVRAVDTATHPDYQRQGIFSMLTRQAMAELTAAGTHLVFNTPNQRSLPGYLKMGWQVVDKWPLFVKVLKPIRLLTRLAWRRSDISTPFRFEQFFGPEVVSWSVFVYRYQDAIPALLSTWESERERVGLRTPRDLAYLQWRYGQHPHLQYGCYPFEERGKLAGCAILRPNIRYSLQEIVLTEIFLGAPDIKLGKLLFNNLCEQLNGDYLIAHFAAGSLERKLLRSVGFLRIPRQGMIFTVRPLNVTRQEVLDATAWDLSLGDLEMF